jgi:hypothetical protein
MFDNPRSIRMKKCISILAAALVLTAGSGAALARQDGADKAVKGSSAASHISEKGFTNTNGPNAATRGTGLERAAERMNESGLTHSKSRDARLEHKPEGKPGKAKGRQ